jgi:DNA-binding PadR family transcriptional regulator
VAEETPVQHVLGGGQSAELRVLTLLRDGPHPTEYLAIAAKTQGIMLYDGNILTVLEKLISQGLVEKVWRYGANGLPARFYGLTPQGEARLARLLGGTSAA